MPIKPPCVITISGTITAAERLRSEHVISVAGEIVLRDEVNRNPNLPTGDVELSVASMEVLAESPTPPFPVDEDTPVEDSGAVWSPDGTRLAIARRYLDGRYTPGKQIYLLDPDTGEIEPLVVDPEYNHGALRWDASGRRIVFQRFSLSTAGARPEIWTVDVETGALELIAENAYLPAWVP